MDPPEPAVAAGQMHLHCRESVGILPTTGGGETVLTQVFQRFAEYAPMPVMARLVLDRVLTPATLNAWFEKTTERQYTRALLFSSVFEVMSLGAFKVFPSVHAA